jgi:hypothetical protein
MGLEAAKVEAYPWLKVANISALDRDDGDWSELAKQGRDILDYICIACTSQCFNICTTWSPFFLAHI